MTVYEADWICPASSEPIHNGAIAVEEGRITRIGTPAEIPGAQRMQYAGCAIIPGFVNAHAHLELTILRGLLENIPFLQWIQRLTHIKYQILTRDDLKLSAQLGAIEMLRAGVTTVAEVMDVGTGWEAMKEFGLQGTAYQEVFGPAESVVAESMKGLVEKVNRYRIQESATMKIGVSPHAPYTVSRPLYEAVRDYARKESLRMTAHVAESRDETGFVRDGAGPFAAAHAKRGIQVTARRCMPVAYMDSLGLLGPDMLLVHCVEANERDLDRLRDTRTFVVHCPKSNAKLGNGTARIHDMLEQRVRVSLGTDSVASNNVIDMFEEMRAAIFQQRTLTGRIDAMTAADAFRMATIEGARGLGLEAQLGSLEPGKRADFAVIDLSSPATQPVYDPVESMVYSASRANVRRVFTAGREVALDDSEVLKEVRRVVQKLL
jgi:5-methylthioadenosine/S-adenosylhomocysteine deaminase